MRARKLGAALALVALVATTLTGCGFHGLYSASLPGGAALGSNPFSITLEFNDVLDLVPQSAVKVDDIAVGKVTSIALDGWNAKVTIELNDSVHLPSNSTAEILQTSLLGEKYVALIRPTGTPASTLLHSGSNIPLSRTKSAPEVEEVLGALSLLLNEGGLRQIKVIANELSGALHGNEPQIRDLLSQLNTFVGTLDSQKSKITSALDDINQLAITLNRQKRVLTSSLDIFPSALNVLSQERGKLVTLLTSLSHLGTVATQVVNATSDKLVSSLKSLGPVLDQFNASGNNLPDSLKILGTFPFPLGTTRTLVKGDYANLDAYLNLDLSNTLCGIDDKQIDPKQLLCKVGKKLPQSVRHRRLAPSSNSATSLQPSLIGAGG